MSAIHVLIEDVIKDAEREVPTLLEGELVPDNLLRKAFSALVQRLAVTFPHVFEGSLPEAQVVPAPTPSIVGATPVVREVTGTEVTGASTTSTPAASSISSDPQQKIAELEAKLAEKDKVIAAVASERSDLAATARPPQAG